jgi:hypothetical protein
MPKQELITNEEFIERTQMDHTQLYLLYQESKIPTVRIKGHYYVDVNDERIAQYLPDRKARPKMDLF